MATNNDNRILELKKQIDIKRTELGKQPRFIPLTTCLFERNGNRINLHALTSVKQVNELLVFFNLYVMSAKDLELDASEIELNGFPVTDWIMDLKSKKAIIEYTDKKEQLIKLEKKLDKLLSDDKKTELEIDAIADLLG